MSKFLNVTARFSKIFAVLLLLETQNFASADDMCLKELNTMKEAFSTTNLQMVVSGFYLRNFEPFEYSHVNKQDSQVSVWKNLNGEIRGYVYKDDLGYDFNEDRSFSSPLTWHPTLVWDKLLASNRALDDFSCILTGRVRLAGKKVTLIRLVPQDGLRYGYVIAKDDESSLPVELITVDVSGNLVSKITVLSSKEISSDSIKIDEDLLYDYEKKGEALEEISPWQELKIPKAFSLIDSGVIKNEDIDAIYQVFSDGISSFRVYKNKKSSNYINSFNNGPLNILKVEHGSFEYAAVGDVPMALLASVLSFNY